MCTKGAPCSGFPRNLGLVQKRKKSSPDILKKHPKNFHRFDEFQWSWWGQGGQCNWCGSLLISMNPHWTKQTNLHILLRIRVHYVHDSNWQKLIKIVPYRAKLNFPPIWWQEMRLECVLGNCGWPERPKRVYNIA